MERSDEKETEAEEVSKLAISKCSCQLPFDLTISDLQRDLMHLQKELEQQNRRLREQEERVHVQEELLRKKDQRFSEQVEELNRNYERLQGKDDEIRRLEADAIIGKNTREKIERNTIRERKENAVNTPRRPIIFNEPGVDNSFFGIPLAAPTSRPPMTRSTTFPSLSGSRPPVTRLPRSLSAKTVGVGLPPISEMSPSSKKIDTVVKKLLSKVAGKFKRK